MPVQVDRVLGLQIDKLLEFLSGTDGKMSVDMDANEDPTVPLLEPKSRTPLGKIRNAIAAPFRLCLAHKNDLAVCAGPVAAILLWRFLHINGDEDGKIGTMIGIMGWVFIWWVTEAIPIAITALAPLFLLPFAQIRTATQVSKSYMNDTIFLLIGSFILAAAVEHYSLHKRMALRMMVVLGGKKAMDPWLLLLGFCIGPAFISMWIHNTAAAVMMMPIGLGVLQNAGSSSSHTAASDSKYTIMEDGGKPRLKTREEEEEKEEEQRAKAHVLNFSRAVVLAIAYAVTLGGMATLTGTGVNLILAGLYESAFPNASPITYLQWMLFGFPLAFVMVMVLWVILCLWFCPRSSVKNVAASLHNSHIEDELKALGPLSFAEIMVLSVFGVLILLWLTKSIGTEVKGWGDLFNGYPGNGTISVVMATTLFIIPSRLRAGEKLMDWKKCKGIPWGIILLLGGGFALADGMTASGLSDFISEELDFLQAAPYLLIAPVIALLTAIVTEFTSNNSTATIFAAVMAQVATSIGRHPLYLMIPACVGAQFSFMLPIATPANAIAYSAGYLRTVDIISVGCLVKLTGILLLSVFMPTLGALVFDTNSSS